MSNIFKARFYNHFHFLDSLSSCFLNKLISCSFESRNIKTISHNNDISHKYKDDLDSAPSDKSLM